MANWKKVVVSGSSISQLSNDSLYIHTGSSGVALTGSFTGSFVGDGSGLSGVTTDITALNAHTASVDAFTGSIDAKVSTLIDSTGSVYSHVDGLLSSTGSNYAHIANLNSFTGSFSSSVESRITAQEAFSASLDATFASEADLVAATASLSASLASSITDITTTSQTFTGSFTGSFVGDGSGLSGIVVTQNATVESAFTSATTASIIHNFDSKNVIVTVYDSADQQFIPATVWAKTNDEVEIHFEGTETGRAVVARGGHIVSGSIPYENLIAVPANIVSGSGQILVVTEGTGVISGSSQIAELGAGIISGAAQLPDGIVSSSAQTIANLPAGTISGSQQIEDLGDIVVSGSFSGSFVGDGSQLSGVTSYTDSDTLAYINSVGVLSGSAQIASEISGSFTSTSASIASDIASLDSTKADKTAVTGAFAASSGSFSTRVTSLESSVGAGGLLSSSAQIADNISGSFTSTSASLASDIADNLADINAIHTYTSSLKTAITVAGSNVTIAGDLEVSGTTTTVDSTTVTFSDNIIALNGTGAANGGIEVNDANGPASGSLLWDGTNNQWIAGGQGSETKIFTKGGNDGLLSGSAQIASNISGSVTALSSSIETRLLSVEGSVGAGGLLSSSAQIASDISGSFTSVSSSIAGRVSTEETNVDVLQSHVGNIHAFTSSADGEITALMAFTASAARATAITGSFTLLSASIAADIAGVSAGALESGSFAVTLKHDTGSIAFTEGLEIGDVYDQGNGTTDIRVPNGAAWLELNYADTDFIYLDGTDAGITLDNTYEWKFYGATGTMIAPGEIRTSGTISGSKFVLTNGQLLSGSGQLATIANVATTISGSSTTLSSSLATRVTAQENFSSSLTSTFATDAEVNTATASLSSSLAVDIASNLASITATDGEVTNLMAATGSQYAHIGNIHAFTASADGEITSLMSFTGSFSSSVATEIAALEAFSSSLDATFATDAYVLTVSASLSSSLATDIATNKTNLTALDGEVTNLMASTGSIYAHVGNLNAATSSYATKTGLGLVSASVLAAVQQGEVKLTTNGVDGSTVDLGLQTTDSPTFAGLTVTGDLVVTGNTIEAQVTNLNIEDKYILLNSGSATIGDSGIVFGGSSGVANSGAGLFWDASYNSNDGRLAIIGAINAGSTGDQTPSYHVAGVYQGSELFAGLAKADHVGNIRVENGDIFIYV